MSLAFAASALGLGLLQGALVALPRADALARLTRLSSPAWAILLPGLILLGTFGLAVLPSGAEDLLVFATVATPVLALLGALTVVRRPASLIACALVVACGLCAVLAHGVLAHASASLVTAGGAMLLGSVIVRLLPGRWLLSAVAAMCLLDVVLMNLGIGRASSHLLDQATLHFHGPTFDAADVGRITTEYPDVLLAAVIGALVAGRPGRARTAVLVVICVTGFDLLLLVDHAIPATPPLCVALVLSELLGRAAPLRAHLAQVATRRLRRPVPASAAARVSAPRAAALPASVS